MTVSITPATTPEDLSEIRQLFIEYQDWLNVDLCFQGFQTELDTLPGKYECLLLARISGEVCGGVGFWPMNEEGTCEMKRLFVRDAFKGHGTGRKLAAEITKRAKDCGYTTMCLDTLERLQPAIKLYESLGFEKCAPYYENPLDHVVYMKKAL